MDEPELRTLLFEEEFEDRFTVLLFTGVLEDERLTADAERLELLLLFTVAERTVDADDLLTFPADRLVVPELLLMDAADDLFDEERLTEPDDRLEELLFRFTEDEERLFEPDDLLTEPEERLFDRFLCTFPLLLFEDERLERTELLLEEEEDRLLTEFVVLLFRTVVERLLTRDRVVADRFTCVVLALERTDVLASLRRFRVELDRTLLLLRDVIPEDLKPVLLALTVLDERLLDER